MRRFTLPVLAVSVLMISGQGLAEMTCDQTNLVELQSSHLASKGTVSIRRMSHAVEQAPSDLKMNPAEAIRPTGIVPYFWTSLSINEVPTHVVN